jgi:hypothetical protein
MALIGVVCEGSHDYCFLSEIIDQVLLDNGHSGNTFRALQPQVDATSAQLGQGGYEAVHQWLLTNKQGGLRTYFESALFATSPRFDAIVVQMDGDVANLSVDFAASPFAGSFATVQDRVSAVRSWILGTVQAEPAYALSVISAVPTLQTEAWIVAAFRPTAQQVETRNKKRGTKKFLRSRYAGKSALDQVKLAGNDARVLIPQMRQRSISFDLFHSDLGKRFP